MDDESISKDKKINIGEEELSKNENMNKKSVSKNENENLYKKISDKESVLYNKNMVTEEKVPKNENKNMVTEEKVPKNENKNMVTEDKVPKNDSKNMVTEKKVYKNDNKYMVTEKMVLKNENKNMVTEEKVPKNENKNMVAVEKVPMNENKNMAKEEKVLTNKNMVAEKNVPKNENKNLVIEEKVPKNENKNLVIEEKVPKNENRNMTEEKALKCENKNMVTEEKVSKNENKNIMTEKKEPKNGNKSMVIEEKVPMNENKNMVTEENVPKSENKNMVTEENVPKNENKNMVTEENVPKNENKNMMTEEKVPNNENKNMVTEEKIPKNESKNMVKDKLSTDQNPNIINENGTKRGSADYEKSKSCVDENEKEKSATTLLDTLTACLPKSSRSETVSVPLPPPEDTSSTVSNSSLDDDFERGTWSRQLDFFLSCVGYAVGLGNIWRFPYLCYRSGGGAFLIPYVIFLIICGMPLFFLEMSFGQFASLGPIAIWKICPLFKGLGYGMVVISVIVCIYYNVIIAWTLYYTYQSIYVPWKSCTNLWNTENCIDSLNSTVSSYVNSSQIFNESSSDTMLNATILSASSVNRTTSSQEFWLFHVLRQSSGIDSLGELQLPLVLTLFIAWVVVFLCLQKGVKSSGKVVYFSATFPYLILVILLIRGLTLPGAWKGIAFYLSPRWEKLMTFKVWADAATQIFYSVGAAWGAILTMSSYNKFSNNVYRDSMLIPLINCGTSIFAGFVVFAIIGFMAYETGKPIDKVVSEGPGLAFIVYPEAVARLPLSPIWAILFFIMLFTIGLDSQFGMFETAISAFVDEFPSLLKKRKTLFTAFLCFVLFLLGLPCVTQGGIYILQLMDWYSATFSLMIISLLESIVICHIYGINRFMADINLMIKRTPSLWWKLCWCYITPGTIISLLIFIFINHQPVTYDKYVYPEWSIIIGWLIAFCSIIPIPLVAAIQIAKANGTLKERFLSCLTPSPEWGPALEENRILYKKSLSAVTSKFPQEHFSGLSHSASNAHMVEESGLSMVQNDDALNPNRESSV